MSKARVLADKSQAGFTLVELAIVMIIIGLLIGGVLKGQELISGAQVTGTVSQVKAIDAATTTFRDTFNGMAGDLTSANTRLPNCTTAPCSNAGNNDNKISGSVTAAPTAEMQAFFAQLSAADLITGINTGLTGASTSWGGYYPEAKIGGGFHAAFNSTASLGTNSAARAGHYLVLHSNPGASPSSNTTLTAVQASRIDTKLDDGVPNSGSVFTTSGGTCNPTPNQYATASGAALCDMFIRFQN